MAKLHQDPIDLDKQIENLLSLGLIVNDKVYAKELLKRISYYRLIKAYSITLKENGRYRDGTTFEEIVDLYSFDMELRHAIFPLIEHVEIAFRAEIANYFSLKYGNFGYENIDNYKEKEHQQKVLCELKNEIMRNKRSPFISNFQKHYEGHKIPLYAAIEVTSFGSLSKMYKNMQPPDKKDIAETFGVKSFYLESWIENLSYVRNICAHYGRLYGARLTKTAKIYEEYTNQGVSNSTIFASILNLKIIAKERTYNQFCEKLKKIVDDFPSVDLKPLGFVENWEKLLK